KIDGLWALSVGNGASGGRADTVYFTAGLFGETHGLFGSLTPVASGTAEGPAEQQMVTAFLDEFQLAVQTLNNDLVSGAALAQIRQDRRAANTALLQFLQAETNFVIDTAIEQGTGIAAARSLARAFTSLRGHMRI